MSKLGNLYDFIYAKICGKDAHLNIFHFQYLATYQLHADLKNILCTVSAENVLDLGCGNKPYKDFFLSYKSYIGADILPAKGVDVVLDDPTKLPFENEMFDFVLSTQVFEHVEDLTLLSEVYRVLKKNGVFLISVPFLYHVHNKYGLSALYKFRIIQYFIKAWVHRYSYNQRRRDRKYFIYFISVFFGI